MTLENVSLEQKIGQLLILGYKGTDENDTGCQLLGKQIASGEVGGIISYGYNIENSQKIQELNSFFKSKSPNSFPLLSSIDQEGGKVQRLNSLKGFVDTPSAKDISQMTEDEAYEKYEILASQLKKHHFNLNYAPCVDMNPKEYLSPIIGELHRSYGATNSQIEKYASIMIKAMHSQEILNCIKHFPGHGSAKGDTHENFVEVTDEWSSNEMEPFFQLIKNNTPDTQIDMIMTAHVFNAHLDRYLPATLSVKTLDLLRQRGYNGIIISDDLHMGAIQEKFTLKESIIASLNAGNDMVIFSNNGAAAKNIKGFMPDPELPYKFSTIIKEALNDKLISITRIDEAFQRVQRLKNKLSSY